MKNSSKQSKVDILDIDKLQAQVDAGFTIRKLSIIWNIPYASLYMALKKNKNVIKNKLTRTNPDLKNTDQS